MRLMQSAEDQGLSQLHNLCLGVARGGAILMNGSVMLEKTPRVLPAWRQSFPASSRPRTTRGERWAQSGAWSREIGVLD